MGPPRPDNGDFEIGTVGTERVNIFGGTLPGASKQCPLLLLPYQLLIFLANETLTSIV
jgi:hypothetical protein